MDIERENQKTVDEYKNSGTHITHCCAKHGCKYSYECPVVDKVAEQAYPCPYCRPTSTLKEDAEALREEIAWSESLEARGFKLYDEEY